MNRLPERPSLDSGGADVDQPPGRTVAPAAARRRDPLVLNAGAEFANTFCEALAICLRPALTPISGSAIAGRPHRCASRTTIILCRRFTAPPG